MKEHTTNRRNGGCAEVYDMIIENGTIITSNARFKADLGIKNGIISDISTSLKDAPSLSRLESKNYYVLPGAVDVHAHLEREMCDTISADSYETGTRAAACGGTTTVFDFIFQNDTENIIETLNKHNERCKKQASVDYSFNVVFDRITDDLEDDLEALMRYGINHIKLSHSMSQGNIEANAQLLFYAVKDRGFRISVHEENKAIINNLSQKYLEQKKCDAWYYYLSRPEYVEAEADMRLIHWAKHFGGSLYLEHLACRESVDRLTDARIEGYDVIGETCPQYLCFTNEVYKKPDGYKYVCAPPMKGEDSREALWRGINNESISIVASDHCPFQLAEKRKGIDDFSKIPNGCMAIENRYPYLLSEANKGRISFEKAVAVCSTNPARIFGCAPQKGTIAPGSDADLVIYDPQIEFTISAKNMHSNLDYTIWEGIRLKGYPIITISRGKIVYDYGRYTGSSGWGKYIKRQPAERTV